MKKFLAIYTGSAAGMAAWKVLDDAERQRREQAGKAAWGEWVAAHRQRIVDPGAPLG